MRWGFPDRQNPRPGAACRNTLPKTDFAGAPGGSQIRWGAFNPSPSSTVPSAAENGETCCRAGPVLLDLFSLIGNKSHVLQVMRDGMLGESFHAAAGHRD